MSELDPKRLQNFIDNLSQFKNRRIHLNDLWKIFNTAFPHRPRGAELRQWLLAALKTAVEQNVIKLPVEHGKRWDRTLQPSIPTSVDRMELAPPSPNDEWRRFPWHPRLAWVADLTRITPEQEEFLRGVNYGFAQGLFEKSAPFKYRSLQLTGNEKRLKALTKTELFKTGRLSLELLGCVPEIPPLVYEKVSDRAIAIVFENAAPFKIAHEVLTNMSSPPYGIVAFGGGRSFQQSIRNFGSIKQSVERIEYVGDLDRPGLRIAQAAAKITHKTGLPPLVAAQGMHNAMLQASHNFGYPLGLPHETKDSAKDDEALVVGLPPDMRCHVLDILRAERRVPEEILSSDEMSNLWHQIHKEEKKNFE